MATLSKIEGRRIIQVVVANKRHTLSLGKIADRDARTIKAHVEYLANAIALKTPVPLETASWLASISDKLHAKIVNVKLTTARAPRHPTEIGSYFDGYIKRRTDLKQSTIDNLKQSRTSITDFFGEKRDMATITRGDAQDWHRQAGNDKAGATVAMYVKKIRQVYQDAIDRKLVTENPFLAVKIGSMSNAERQVYVPVADIEKVIDVCPTNEWKMLFAAARYQGMRIPSETKALEWGDVLWAENKMRVRAAKTAHHEGKATRMIPIFPEFMRFLLVAFSDAERDAKYVFPKLRGTNLRTQAERIIGRSDVASWVKPFQNLRSSCETDLTSRFPLHVACAWIGNSTGVALKHYLQVTDAHFESAARGAVVSAGQERTDTGHQAHNAPKNQANQQSSIPPVGVESVAVSRDLLQAAHQALHGALQHLNLNAARDELIGGLSKAVGASKSNPGSEVGGR